MSAEAAGFRIGASRAPSLAWLWAEVRAQAEHWFLWAPVALGSGAAVYIGLRVEPHWIAAVAPAVVLILCAAAAVRSGRNRAISLLFLLAAFAASGFAAGKIRTLLLAGPVTPVTGATPIRGWVVDIANPGESGGRLVIAPTAIKGLAADQLPKRIRLTVGDNLVEPGTAVRLVGLLNPPPPPASPGAYDFARNAYFDGIGGVGLALTEPRPIALPKPPAGLALEMRINAVRWSLAQRVASKMSKGSAGLGAAMVTGHEAFVEPATEDALRDTGLAHIISISGLHMAIVGGFAFLLARWLIAAIPWLAVRVPGKKIAAVFGLAAVGTYLVISGAPPPAERAAITAAVAFCAILADRRAISLHALAIAAVIVILLQPEAVAEPGFQMSFSATAALVAIAERWRGRPREINTPWPIRLVQDMALWVGVSLAASFVAGLATGPFAIQHFNRVAVYGLPANLLVEPLSTFVIMPFLALGATLEAIGLGGPFLAVAGFGIDLMNSGAAFIASLPHATMTVPSAPSAALAVSFLGILMICLWKGRLRWLGVPAMFAVLLWPRSEPPLAWFDPEGGAAAVRRGEQAILMRPDARLFAAELWARRRGLTLPQDGRAAREGVFACNSQHCRAVYEESPRLSAWWTVRKPNAETLEALCRSSDYLAMKAEVALPPSCAETVVLRPRHFAQGGSLEIYADGRLQWTSPLRGRRPWSGG